MIKIGDVYDTVINVAIGISKEGALLSERIMLVSEKVANINTNLSLIIITCLLIMFSILLIYNGKGVCKQTAGYWMMIIKKHVVNGIINLIY